MIDRPAEPDSRTPRFLIADNTPLSLLGAIGALDWLFVPGCEVWMTDMVMEEATRDPGEGQDPRRRVRAAITAWIDANRYRIKRLETPEGLRYAREMELWQLAGSPRDLKPDWADRGEASVLGIVKGAKRLLAKHETIIAIVDDRDARDAIRAIRTNIDMMGTQTFIRWIDEDFAIPEACHAWNAIQIAMNDMADPGEDDDPVDIRTGP